MFCCNWVCRLDLYSARPRPNHCQMVDRVPASGDIYEACGRLEVEGRRGGGGGGRGGAGLEIHPRRLSFVVWERVRWKIESEWWRISGQPADFIWLFCWGYSNVKCLCWVIISVWNNSYCHCWRGREQLLLHRCPRHCFFTVCTDSIDASDGGFVWCERCRSCWRGSAKYRYVFVFGSNLFTCAENEKDNVIIENLSRKFKVFF